LLFVHKTSQVLFDEVLNSVSPSTMPMRVPMAHSKILQIPWRTALPQTDSLFAPPAHINLSPIYAANKAIPDNEMELLQRQPVRLRRVTFGDSPQIVGAQLNEGFRRW
jgi:hypothetical protein